MKNQTKSAGGVVVRGSGAETQIVMLRDRNYHDWTLPKGKLPEK